MWWNRGDRAFGALLGLLLVSPWVVLCCGPEFSQNLEQFCLTKFSSDMDQIDQSQWCSWEDTLQSYEELTNCTYLVALRMGCFWPNVEVDSFFVEVHRRFFGACAVMGRRLQDPPSNVTSPFIITPILITLLVTGLVVWRSQRNEGIA